MLYTSRATLLLKPVSGVVVVRLVDDHLILVPHEPSKEPKQSANCRTSLSLPMVLSRVMFFSIREG